MRNFLRIINVAKATLLLALVFLGQEAFAQGPRGGQLQETQQLEFSCAAMPYMDVHERRLRALDTDLNRRLEEPRYMLSPTPPEDNPDAELPDPDPVGAIADLDDLRIDRYDSHEKAAIYNILAYAHYLNDNVSEAIRYYHLIMAEEGTDGSLMERSLRTVTQLYSYEEKYDESLQYWVNWACVRTSKPNIFLAARDYQELANIYYRMEDVGNTLRFITKAISMIEANDDIAPEIWYEMQRSMTYLDGDVPGSLAILKKLLIYYPDVKYWKTLGGTFAELEMNREQLAAFYLAHMQNGLTTESQLKGLGYLVAAAGAPFDAANILVEGIESGLIEEDHDNMELVGSFFYSAREMDKALPWMERAAEEGGEGQAYAFLSNIYLSKLNYEEAIRTGEEALRLGDLNRADQLRLNLGGAYAALREYDEAIRVLGDITDSRSTRIATDYIRYTNNEKAREEQLTASGIDLDNLPDLL